MLGLRGYLCCKRCCGWSINFCILLFSQLGPWHLARHLAHLWQAYVKRSCNLTPAQGCPTSVSSFKDKLRLDLDMHVLPGVIVVATALRPHHNKNHDCVKIPKGSFTSTFRSEDCIDASKPCVQTRVFTCNLIPAHLCVRCDGGGVLFVKTTVVVRTCIKLFRSTPARESKGGVGECIQTLCNSQCREGYMTATCTWNRSQGKRMQNVSTHNISRNNFLSVQKKNCAPNISKVASETCCGRPRQGYVASGVHATALFTQR